MAAGGADSLASCTIISTDANELAGQQNAELEKFVKRLAREQRVELDTLLNYD